MLKPITNTLHGVISITWPMVLISCVVIVGLRISYLIKNKKKFVIYKELLSLYKEIRQDYPSLLPQFYKVVAKLINQYCYIEPKRTSQYTINDDEVPF